MASIVDEIRDESNTTDQDLSEVGDEEGEARKREKNARDKMGENSDPKNDIKVIKLNLREAEDIRQKISQIANEIAEEVQDIRKEEETVQKDINKSEQKIQDKVSTERLLEYFNLLIDVNPQEQYKRSRAHKDDTWEKDAQAEYSMEEHFANSVDNRLTEYEDYIKWARNNRPGHIGNGIQLTPNNVTNFNIYLKEIDSENMRWIERLNNYIDFLNSRFVEDIELEEEELPSQIETLLREFKKLKKETDFLEELEEELENEEKFEQRKIQQEIVPNTGEIKPVVAEEEKQTKSLSKEIKKIYAEEEKIYNQLRQLSTGWQKIHKNEISFLEQELENLEECSGKLPAVNTSLNLTAPGNSGGDLEMADKHSAESMEDLGHKMNRLADLLKSIVGDSENKYEYFQNDVIGKMTQAQGESEAAESAEMFKHMQRSF